jgi:hypothetical protein
LKETNLVANPNCKSLDSLTSREWDIPDGTLTLTLDEEIHEEELEDVGTKTSLTDASLLPKNFPTKVTNTLPDVGIFFTTNSIGSVRLYEIGKEGRLAC